jgi:hypothetical protein
MLVAFGAFGLGNNAAQADIDNVWWIDPFGVINDANPGEAFQDDGDCEAASVLDDDGDPISLDEGDLIILDAEEDTLWLCVELDADQSDSAVLNADSEDFGRWTQAICSNNDGDGDFFEIEPDDDQCEEIEGLNSDNIHIECDEQPNNEGCGVPVFQGETTTLIDVVGGVLLRWICNDETGETEITITTSDDDGSVDSFSFFVSCRGPADDAELTADPTTVEIVPAPSNTAHSLIVLNVVDDDGEPQLIAPSTDVDFTTDRCAIEVGNVNSLSEFQDAEELVDALLTAQPGTFIAWDAFANDVTIDGNEMADNTSVFDNEDGDGSMAAAILHCDTHVGSSPTPGVATVEACLEVPDAADICRTVKVTVIGPPAQVTAAASPSSGLRCGDKATITVTVKDSIGQNVSDHTLVEMVTNLGGTLGGTGAVAGFAGPVVPISSTVAGTFGGVATAFLLTSESHSGPYEVVVTTGGTAPGDLGLQFVFNDSFGGLLPRQTTLGGVFSTAPISTQVTVTCALPTTVAPAAPTVTAPSTGTGITPPSTGEAGLANSTSSSASWTVFALGGVAAFALAGLAALRFARR